MKHQIWLWYTCNTYMWYVIHVYNIFIYMSMNLIENRRKLKIWYGHSLLFHIWSKLLLLTSQMLFINKIMVARELNRCNQNYFLFHGNIKYHELPFHQMIDDDKIPFVLVRLSNWEYGLLIDFSTSFW